MTSVNARESESVDQHNERQKRFVSHALVEVWRFRRLPLLCDSAVLLDMSLGGFKIEFTGEAKIKVQKPYWLQIPLGPLGIPGPKKMVIGFESRWFDHDRYRMGGTFLDLAGTEKLLIEQIILSLREKGQL